MRYAAVSRKGVWYKVREGIKGGGGKREVVCGGGNGCLGRSEVVGGVLTAPACLHALNPKP
jgi:hypothetical protein